MKYYIKETQLSNLTLASSGIEHKEACYSKDLLFTTIRDFHKIALKKDKKGFFTTSKKEKEKFLIAFSVLQQAGCGFVKNANLYEHGAHFE